LIEQAIDAGAPGVIALSTGPRREWAHAAGFADVENGAPITTDHRFPIGSLTKTFVAAVVLQLVGEGMLDLDRPAGDLDATVRQLLNHTSGLPDAHTMPELLALYRQDAAYRPYGVLRDTAALVLEKPRLFAPGEGWSYSGSNYLMLGLLIEDVTGSSLRDELARRVFRPLGLTSSDLPDELPSDVARGYLPPDNPILPDDGPGLVDVTNVLAGHYAGGGMVSTAPEVARFLRGLLGGELVSQDLRVELLHTVVSPWDESDAYGLGIEEITSIGAAASPCGHAWGHLGFTLGHTTIALSSESGDRQGVALFTTHPLTEETWDTMARLAWACYCGV
jgi:D-alanyl-D-alanine carboxypeptidase